MKSSTLLLVSAIIFTGALSEAKDARHQRREHKQEARINKGIENGSLNEAEQRRLQRGQKRVDHAQDKAMADGTVTAKEKLKIEKMQDVQSKRIYRQKHDGQNAQPEAAPAADGQ